MELFQHIDMKAMLVQELSLFSFYTLQSMTIIALVATILLPGGLQRLATLRRSGGIALALGVMATLLVFILQERMVPSIKLVMILDFIFLAGIIGGLRNAVIMLGVALALRYYFGGAQYFWAAALDYTCVAFGAALARTYVMPKRLENMRAKHMALAVAMRFVVVEISALSVWLIGHPIDIIEIVMFKRAVTTLSISAVTLLCSLYLVRHVIRREMQDTLDPVTRLPNRRGLKEFITQKGTRAPTAPAATHTLLLLDIDNFHELAQTYGHEWVDELCKWLAQELLAISEKTVLREYSPCVFSLSESSFVLFLGNTSKEKLQRDSAVTEVFQKLLIAAKRKKNEMKPFFTFTVIDLEAAPTFNPERFLRALTLLDHQHSGRIRFFDTDITQQVEQEDLIRAHLHEWIDAGQAPMALQPKVILETGVCCGAEALLRMMEGGEAGAYIAPHTILQVAEKYRLTDALEQTIVRTVIHHLHQVPQGLEHLTFSVNLTPGAFALPGLGRFITDTLSACNISPERLVVELIETHTLAISATCQDNIAHLIRAGVPLSLDDFGTGYASISLLSQFSFNELKLDYSMTSQSANPRVLAAIQLAVDSAHKYHTTVVAEGIENQEQLEQFMQLGVPFGQGYLFGKAMPFEAFIEYAEKKS